MSRDGNALTVEDQIAALTAQMIAHTEKLRALEAENVAIRTINDELRALIDGVPNNIAPGLPIPTPNDEQAVDMIAPDAPTDMDGRLESAPRTPVSLQSTSKLAKPCSGLHLPIDPELFRRFAEMEALIQRIPGIPTPIKKSTTNSFADSPFVDAIALVDMPRKFSFPNMKQFEGMTDPDDHISQYKQRMFTATVPHDLREACMCKAFGSSLSGPALQWYTNLPNNSINSFAQLTDTFVEQFASSRKLEKQSDDLYTITQKCDENLRAYVGRFNKEKVQIPHCNQSTAISAFRRGLRFDSDLYKELTKYPCKTMEDVLAKAWAQIKWEEDEERTSRQTMTVEKYTTAETSHLK